MPPEQSLEVAGVIKEQMCYVCSGVMDVKEPGLGHAFVIVASCLMMLAPCLVCLAATWPADPAKEAEKVGADSGKYTRRYEGVSRTGTPFAVDVLRERFLGPEIFFSPHTYSGSGDLGWGDVWQKCPLSASRMSAPQLPPGSACWSSSPPPADFRTPLPALIHQVVRTCPIDTRRALYANISLSGGSTMFRHFGQRIQRDLKQAVDARTAGSVDVHVRSHPMQRYAVW